MASITRYRARPLHPLRRELDRLFGEFFPGVGEEDDGDFFSAVWTPRTDVSETESGYVVKMDLPGLEKDQVSVDIEDGMLRVSGERREEEKEEKENYLRLERSYGNFYRQIPLPKKAKIDQAKASFENGVLTIELPKGEEHKPRRVEIT